MENDKERDNESNETNSDNDSTPEEEIKTGLEPELQNSESLDEASIRHANMGIGMVINPDGWENPWGKVVG